MARRKPRRRRQPLEPNYLKYGPGLGSGPKPKVPTYQPPKTPITPSERNRPSTQDRPTAPPAAEASGASDEVAPSTPSRRTTRASSSATKAVSRQEKLVDRFVTHAYEEKVSRLAETDSRSDDRTLPPVFKIGERVKKAKREVEDLRERLLTHPAVEKANTEGKVVAPRGLEKLRRREQEDHPNHGSAALRRGLTAFAVEPPGPKRAQGERREGRQVKNLAKLLSPPRSPRTTPRGPTASPRGEADSTAWSPGNPLALAVERDVVDPAKRAGVLPESKTTGQEIAEGIAEWGPLAFPVGRGLPLAQAATRTGVALRELPTVLRNAPQLAKAGAKAAPKATAEALRSAPKTLPKAVGRGAVQTGKTTYKAGGGLGLLATTKNAGVDTEPGKVADAILKGTSAAVSRHPLETAATTARAAPAAVTGPAALLYTAGQVPFEGTGPLEETASMQWEGLKQITENLLSGNPKRVQKAVQGEGALALLAPGLALSRSTPYKAVRSDVREAAAGIRRLTGKGRQAPPGVEQTVFGFGDRRQARKRVAQTHARTTNPYRISEARHERAVLHGTAKRPALEKVPAEWGDTISTLLEAGIRSPEGVRLMRKRGPKTEASEAGRVNLDRALSIAEANPQMFQSKPFLRALKAAEKASRSTPAALAGMGEVARYRTQGDLFGITPPDRAVPHAARKYTSARDREGAWKDLAQMEKRLTQLKAKRQVKGPKGKRAPKRSAEIKALETRTKKLREALDPYTRPDQKTASGERKFWDKKMEREYIATVKAKQGPSPLVEPAWTHHAAFRSAKEGMEPGALPGKAGGKVYVRRGSLADSDLVDRSLDAFVRGTVQMPRRRQAGVDFAREFVREEKHPFTLGGKGQEIVPDSETWVKITSPKTKDNPDGGQFDPKTYARFPIREWKTAVESPFTTDADLAALLKDAEEGRIAGHEPSVIVPRESIREFRAITNPEHGPVTEFMNTLGRTSTRLILGTNPSWVLAQTVAEGIPLALAKPSLLNPVKTGSIRREIQNFRKEHPEQAAIIEAAAGASPEMTAGALRSPLDLEKQGSFNPQPALFAEAGKQLTRSKWGRAMRSTAKLELLGRFDIKRQNAYRSVLLAAEADKRFRSWTGGVRGMFRTSSRVSEHFRGKSRQEMYTWLTTTKQGKAELQKLSKYVDDVQGNWTAFTRYERAFAPFVIFYPFLRYSLRWTLHTFPKNHPLATTIAAMLGQVNSNELEKVLGGKPASLLSYSFPVVKNAEGETDVLPGGSRIAPGQSVVQQAIVGGKPSQLVGGLNPILGAALTAVGGPGPFGDRPSGPAGWAAVDQLLSLPAPIRLSDIRSEKVAAMLGLARPEPESVIAKAFEKLDPNKRLRQGLLPSAPQSAREIRLANKLSRALQKSSDNSSSKQSDLRWDDSLTTQARQRKVAQMKERSEKARKEIDEVLKALNLDKEAKEAYDRWIASGEEPGGDKSGEFGFGDSFGEFGMDEDFGFGGDKGNRKALNYKPPEAGGISLPGLPGIDSPVGAVGNFLSTLVGGEVAKAATGKGKPKPKATVHEVGGIADPEIRDAIIDYAPRIDRLARERYGISGETLLSKLIQGESGEDMTAVSSAEAKSITQFIPSTREDFVNRLGVDPWRSKREAVLAATMHLDGKHGYSPGLEGYNPGGGQEYVDYILSQPVGGRVKVRGNLKQVNVRLRKQVPKKTMSRFKAAVQAADEIERAQLPYVWGGGHGDPKSRPTGGGLDCSGAVSYVLNKMGALDGSLVSGDMGSVLRPGPGAITVFYNPTHTFMRIGKKYWGTSTANPAGGAGWIPASVAASEAASGEYNVGHVAGLGKKVAVALGVPTGATGTHATSTFPGMTLSNSGTTATLDESSAITRKAPGFSDKPIRLTSTERLKLVNEISEGNFAGLGVPSEDGRVGPSVSDLAALGSSLQRDRLKLLRR